MEDRFIYLSICNTCKRILKELDLPEHVKLQDVKTQPATEDQIEFLKVQSGSYESLFNRRSQQYRGRGLHEKDLTEEDYKSLLLDHYSFLKRPVLVYQQQAFIGNSKKTVAAAKEALAK
jgi:arsenate reductase-like glutaredoxin family protein